MRKSVLLLAACSAVLVSCGKIGEDGLFSRASGEEVVFSLSNQPSSPNTKSTYSGETIEGIERIDWVEGESLDIACEQTLKDFFKYTISSVSTQDHRSLAEVTHDPGETGLRWNENDKYYFYAMSPAGNDLTPRGTGFFTLDEDQKQDVSKSGWSGTNFKSAVHPDYIQMTSYSIVNKTSDDFSHPVNLPFVMLPTALEFTLQGEKAMKIDKVMLESTDYITGRYYVYIDKQAESGLDYPVTGLVSDGGKKKASITLRDGDYPVSVAQGSSVTFTFMLLPKDIQNVTLFLTREDESGKPYTVKTKLSYADGTALKFDAHKKYRITGMIVPDGIRIIIDDEEVTVTPFEPVAEIEINPL